MKRKHIFLPLLLLLIFITGCSASASDSERIEITVSAAASLTDALNEIKASFEKENPNIKVIYNFGGSGTLQQQILQGAPTDLFFSAAKDKFEELVSQELIEKEIDLAGNQIVLVTPKDSKKEIKTFEDLKEQAESISIGTPESVPAGKYAKELLENIGIWTNIEDKMVPAKDVRQVLTYVETGNVDAGIVYYTDAIVSTKVNIQEKAKEGTHTPIIYPLGLIKESRHLNEAKVFYEYMQSKKALDILEKYGFLNLLK